MSQADGAAAAAREVRRSLEQLLGGAGPAISGSLPDDYLQRAEAYATLLLQANQRLNLTRVTEPSEVARLHLLDALAALPLLDALGATSAIDLGSGGGVPGIPLALARPEVRWLLVDSVGKKVAVVREFIAALGLTNVTAIAERAETLGQSAEHRERYDMVAARACAPLPVLAELALPLLREGGQVIAWKGPLDEGDEELRRGRAAAAQVGGGEVQVLPVSQPALGGHTFVTIPKDRPTPARYPRRPGEPSRRPLA